MGRGRKRGVNSNIGESGGVMFTVLEWPTRRKVKIRSQHLVVIRNTFDLPGRRSMSNGRGTHYLRSITQLTGLANTASAQNYRGQRVSHAYTVFALLNECSHMKHLMRVPHKIDGDRRCQAGGQVVG